MGGKTTSLYDHPNFSISGPRDRETQIAYALRMAAHLLSPPKKPGENDSIACEDAAVEIQRLSASLESLWAAKNKLK